MPFLIAFAICAPLLPLLAEFPPSPDGAEMVSVAVNGGVLHPSGIPLQWWINRIFVGLSPWGPGWAVSFISWLGGVGTVSMLLLFLRRLGVRWWIGVLSALALVYTPVFALMSVTPEKYTWLAFTQILFVYLMARVVLQSDGTQKNYIALGLALGLAFAQHSANVILLPPFLYVVVRPLWVELRKGVPLTSAAVINLSLSLVSAGVMSSALYTSLLWQRSILPWPDWGQLETIRDVWNHVVRQDYGVVSLYNNPGVGQNSISAPGLLFKSLLDWHLAFWLVPVGMVAAWLERESRAVMGYLWMILLPGLAVLASTQMPSGDLDTVMGYQERYPILLLPLLAVFWAWGLEYFVTRWARWKKWIGMAVGLAVLIHMGFGIRSQLWTNNNLSEIYREQARSELVEGSLFWTGSDFTGFYGLPFDPNGAAVDSRTLYPLKSLLGMDWYREKTLPKKAPELGRLLQNPAPPTTIEDLIRQALNQGVSFSMTEPGRFIHHADIMAKAEQTGVLWIFRPNNQSLYTDAILQNSLKLCDRFPKVWKGLPESGLWFLREYLQSFRFSFMSAGDYLQSLSRGEAASSARAVAEVLVPGIEPKTWIERCENFKNQLGR